MSEFEVNEQANEFLFEADFIGRVFERLVRDPHSSAVSDVPVGDLAEFHEQIEAARSHFSATVEAF